MSKSFRKVLIALIILIPVILIGTGIYIRTLKPGNTEETRTPGLPLPWLSTLRLEEQTAVKETGHQHYEILDSFNKHGKIYL